MSRAPSAYHKNAPPTYLLQSVEPSASPRIRQQRLQKQLRMHQRRAQMISALWPMLQARDVA